MASMAAVQALSLVFGGILAAAHPAPAPLPLVSRPQVEAAGLTVYWDVPVAMPQEDCIQRIERLDENLYVITNQGRVIALDSATGVKRWVADITGPDIRIFGPTHDTNRVFFASVQGIQAYDRATGELRLRWKGTLTPCGPVVSDDLRIFGGDTDSRLTALDQLDMQIDWELNTDGLVTSKPILIGPNIFFVSHGGTIYAATKEDKVRLWPPQKVPPVNAEPAVRGNDLYVPTMQQSLYCFDLTTGRQRWESRMPAPLSVSPKVTRHGLYQPVGRFGISSVEPATGQVRWTLPDGADLLAEHQDLVWFISSRSSLLGCNRADGEIRQEVPIRADVYQANSVDDAIYLASGEGRVACIRPAGAGFLRYRTMMESAARVSTQPAGDTPKTPAQPKDRAPADYLRGSQDIPPIAGNNKAPAAKPE